MKKLLVATLFITLILAGVALAGVVGTKHDLTVGSQGYVCAGCHTPHAAADQTNGPLWNRTQAAQAYTFYSSATFDMSLPALNLGPQSIACLTCHNGVGSALVNFPGPGGSGNPVTLVGDGNTIDVTDFSDIGTDLTNDHPVGFEFDQTEDTNFETAAAITAGGLVLYGANDKFECATCHDVHNKAVYPDQGVVGGQVYFLRISNTNSAMCTLCHTDKA